jgi:hypothetical protein
MTGEQQAIAVAPVLLLCRIMYVVGKGVNSTTTAKRFLPLVYHRSRQLPQHPQIHQILPSKDHDQEHLSIILLSMHMRHLV